MLARPSTGALIAILAFVNCVAARVRWDIGYTMWNDQPRCVSIIIWDDAVGGMPQVVNGRNCNGYDHGGDQRWTFDFGGPRAGYSATIKQTSFYYRDGFGFTYRTDHGTFWWDSGPLEVSKEVGGSIWHGMGYVL